jgi:hypothetical protein
VHLNIALAPEVVAIQSFLTTLCDRHPVVRDDIMAWLQSRRSATLIEGRAE